MAKKAGRPPKNEAKKEEIKEAKDIQENEILKQELEEAKQKEQEEFLRLKEEMDKLKSQLEKEQEEKEKLKVEVEQKAEQLKQPELKSQELEETKETDKPEQQSEQPKQKPKSYIKQKRDLNEMVCVRNATMGSVVYSSKRTQGYKVEWEKMGSEGDENYIELSELVAMRNSYPRVFQECWLIIEDTEIIDYLNVRKYYNNIVDVDDFDGIFNLKPEKLEDKLRKMPKGLRDAVAQRAKQLLTKGEFDSIRNKKVIEKVLNIDLDF